MQYYLRKKIIISFTIMILFAGMFIVSHITPALAVKSELFITGHPIVAMTVKVRYNDFQQRFDLEKLNKMNAKIYEITNSGTTFNNGTSIHNFIVKRVGYYYYYYYYADYWGEM